MNDYIITVLGIKACLGVRNYSATLYYQINVGISLIYLFLSSPLSFILMFTEAVNCLLKAIEIYTDMGRFTMAAKHHQTIAEVYETEAVDLDRAVQHYEQAADYFKGEESNSSANKCLLKVAQYAAQLENYDKAIQIYEQVIASFFYVQLN